MQHHTPHTRPKWDRPADDDTPSVVYPVLPQRRGVSQGSYGYGSQSGHPAPGSFLRNLQAMMWLVDVLVSAYCVYYLLPCGHLAVLGIVLHP